MPTYDYRCTTCGSTGSVFQSIGEYSRNPLRFYCEEHGEMERKLSVVPAMSGLANALAGDRHYDGLRASDGTDISSRTKHRAYMKANDLTTMDDFKDTWAKNAAEKAKRFHAQHSDPELRHEIAKQVTEAVAKPD